MLLNVLDALSNPQVVVTASQIGPVTTAADQSGTIAATGVAQTLMAGNAQRSGWVVQNQGTNDMWINEIGQNAASTGAPNNGSVRLGPGEVWPPPLQPVPTVSISILGTGGDFYMAREYTG